jgi:hypothetical protein
MNKKPVKGKFQFESKSTPGKIYEVSVYPDNTLSCNCKGWIFSRSRNNGERTCKHTKLVYSDMMSHVSQKKHLKMIPCTTEWVTYHPEDIELFEPEPGRRKKKNPAVKFELNEIEILDVIEVCI